MQYTNLKDGIVDFILGDTNFFFTDDKEYDSISKEIINYANNILGLNYKRFNSNNPERFLKRNIYNLDPDSVYIAEFNFPTIEDFYNAKIVAKKYNNIKFFFRYDLNKLNHYYLNNLDKYTEIYNNSSFYLKDNLIAFNSFEEFIEYSQQKFNRQSLDLFIDNLKSNILNSNISIRDFGETCRFLSLKEDDCLNWHKFLCKTIFNIPYTDFKKIYFIPQDKGYRLLKVTEQSENYIYLNNYLKYPFKRNDAYDDEINRLFNYYDLNNCLIPQYIDVMTETSYRPHVVYVGMNQLKYFYEQHPTYFSNLVYTLKHYKTNKLIIVS